MSVNNDRSPYAQKPWLKHYPAQVGADFTFPDIVVNELLHKSAQEFPNHSATNFFGRRLTYSELLMEAKRFAGVLVNFGVTKGDRVALMLPNCPQAVIAYYGTLSLGAVVVETNPLYVERELEFQLQDSGAETIVVLDLLYPKVASVRNATRLKNVIVTSLQDYLPFPKNVLYSWQLQRQGKWVKPEPAPGVCRWSELRSADVKASGTELKPSDLALLQYTGGTTGVAKGVMLTHGNLVANVYQLINWMIESYPGKERMLCALPFFHVYGMTVAMNIGVALAGELIILPKFEIKTALQAINKYRPTLFPGTPTMYVAINTYPQVTKYNISSIRTCLSGSAPLPVEVQETFEELTGGNLVEGYGLTEASPVTHCNPLAGMRKRGAIGLPLPGTECKIVDPNTWEEVAVGEEGELAVKGPQVMTGYWNKPLETKAAMRDGWLFTGDIARMDEDGYFFVVDRKKDIIIAGGFNIYPREIEEVLYRHPAVKEVAVAGIPDAYRGETVKAYLVLKPGEEASAEEIMEYCRGELAAFKAPRIIEFRDELPKTIVGKVLKRRLLEEERSIDLPNLEVDNSSGAS